MTHVINLSRAKSFARYNRAKKAMHILQEKLEELEGEKVSIDPEINAKLWERGVENPPTKLEVDVDETDTGKIAVLADTETTEEAQKEEEVEETEPEETEESEDSEVDYEEVLSGTVSEAKDAVRDMEGPDYERLLKLEEEGKDRKTLKEFLEDRA